MTGGSHSGMAFTRGTTQSGVRAYNERLALSLIRLHGQLPKAEIARLTGLSAQTVSVIVRHLENDGLLRRLTPQRGKVGQPLVPFELDPGGAYAIGLKVGRRSADLMLLDLAGTVCQTIRHPYDFPVPQELLGFVKTGLAELTSGLSIAARQRISGLGIATPFELWNWGEEAGAPGRILDSWRGFDLAHQTSLLFEGPVQLCNDATAACAAELLFGRGRDYRDHAYFYVGHFIGGGIVLNGSLLHGRSGNAGGLGSFPVAARGGSVRQLIRTASLSSLERRLRANGEDPAFLWREPSRWPETGTVMDSWIDEASTSIAIAAVGVACVLEPDAVIIDGAMPASIRGKLAKAVRQSVSQLDLQGITPFEVVEGTIGFDARAMGAASLPLFDNFIIDRNVLFKEQD